MANLAGPGPKQGKFYDPTEERKPKL